ncbi:MAG: hypothetical protein KDB61_00070 [Planctomycetes bacterium]|nr:hypothetical protein [Planctomycetota bacterium]
MAEPPKPTPVDPGRPLDAEPPEKPGNTAKLPFGGGFGESLAGGHAPGSEAHDTSPSEVDLLRRSVAGDPFQVRAQVTRRLRERCFLLDPQAVAAQVLAILVVEHPEWTQDGDLQPDTPAVRRAVHACVDRVIDEFVSLEGAPVLVGLSRGGVLSQLAQGLKVGCAELKGACDGFNRLPAEVRRAFHALILQRRSLESACRRSAAAAEGWSSGALRGLQAVLGTARTADAGEPGAGATADSVGAMIR